MRRPQSADSLSGPPGLGGRFAGFLSFNQTSLVRDGSKCAFVPERQEAPLRGEDSRTSLSGIFVGLCGKSRSCGIYPIHSLGLSVSDKLQIATKRCWGKACLPWNRMRVSLWPIICRAEGLGMPLGRALGCHRVGHLNPSCPPQRRSGKCCFVQV